MNAWQVFKLIAHTDDDCIDATVESVFQTRSTLANIGAIESRYTHSAPDAATIGETFGAGVFMLIGPESGIGISRSVATVHVEAVTTFREAEYDNEEVAA